MSGMPPEFEVYTYDDGVRIWLVFASYGIAYASLAFHIEDWFKWLDTEQAKVKKYRIPGYVSNAF